jgi:hypothetical protein
MLVHDRVVDLDFLGYSNHVAVCDRAGAAKQAGFGAAAVDLSGGIVPIGH